MKLVVSTDVQQFQSDQALANGGFDSGLPINFRTKVKLNK
jgi:hypothetical protein